MFRRPALFAATAILLLIAAAPQHLAAIEPAALSASEVRAYPLDLPALRTQLALAPPEGGPAERGIRITLPLPDGRMIPFRVAESSVLSPELRRAHPELRTYRGEAVGVPALSVRLDDTVFGLRAIISTPEGLVLIDPQDRDRPERVTSRWVHDTAAEPFECTVPEPAATDRAGARPGVQSAGDQLRTFRLILMATGEYSQAAGGVPQALAQMTTSVNRINAIFERDVPAHFQLVEMMAFDDPATDPYYSNSRGPLLTRNQMVVDSIFGPDAYDNAMAISITTGYAGISFLPIGCDESYRGLSSVTGPDPFADQYAIKVMPHELGHTVGASHSQDGGSNRSVGAAFEPALGWTIMTSPGDPLSFGDAYFHVASLAQMDTSRVGSACGVSTATGNTPPTVDAGPDYTIPRGTPFVLSGAGSDPDAGDVLSYTWEEYDTAPTAGDLTLGPLFRWRAPTPAPVRALPATATVLSGVADPLEKLPTVDRTMRFRLTARDNHAGAGGHAWDEMTIAVSGAPFTLTSPDGGNTLAAGVPVNVTWNVGGGGVAPQVNLLLSTDSGASWTPLLSGTPNDGIEPVTFALSTTQTHCRVKVEAAGNIFYDVSNADFTIVGDPTGTLLSLLRAEAGRSGIVVRWSLAPQFVWVTLERAAAATGPWSGVSGAEHVSAATESFEDRGAIPGQATFYRLIATDAAGATFEFGPIEATFGGLPSRLAILATSPNPFAGELRIDYAVPRSAPLRLEVIDIQGRRIATLVNGVQPAGRWQATWSGTTDRPPSAGVLFLRLESDGARDVRRLVLAR